MRSMLNHSTFMMINIDSIPQEVRLYGARTHFCNTFCWDYLDSHRTFSFFSAMVMHFSYVSFVLPHHDYSSELFCTVIYQGRFSSVGRNNETSSKGKMYHIPYQQVLVKLQWTLQGPGLLSKMLNSMLVNTDFFYMASDWLAAVLPANQMPGLKIFVE